MKLFISSDIEGTAGICRWSETERGNSDYPYFAEQMTREVSAAVCGARESGRVEEILIKDAHDSACNLIPSMLPRGVKIMRTWPGEPGGMFGGIRNGFDAAAMTGYHSAAYTAGNPLAHTMNTKNQYIRVNGKLASEFMLYSYFAAYYNVPVIFISGDKALCEAAKEFNPGITAAPVSEVYGNASISLHPEDACELIQEKMKEAVSGDISRCRLALPDSFHVEIEFKEYARANASSHYPGVKKVGSKGIEFTADDYYEVMRALYYVL